MFHAGHAGTSALGAGGEVEEALPGEVLDLALAEHDVLGEVLGVGEVHRRATRIRHRQERAEAVGQPLGRHIQRRERDVQVLGVDHDDREREHHRHLREQEGRLYPVVVRPVAEQPRYGVGRERRLALAPREVAGVVLRAAVDEQRDDHQRDHPEDHPGSPGV